MGYMVCIMKYYVICILTFILFSSIALAYSTNENPPPMKQFKKGVPIVNIICKDHLILVTKYDGTPGCVEINSISPLIERGWMEDLQSILGSKESSTLDGNTQSFLSKSVSQWENSSEGELYIFYEIYGSEFYTELGKFLIKNKMQQELEKHNLTNKFENFTVYAGSSLPSLPPHTSYQAVVNTTNDNSYLLEGGTHGNSVSNVRLERLVFYETHTELSNGAIFHQDPLVTIYQDKGQGKVQPYSLVLHLDNATVEFHNKLPFSVRIESENNIRDKPATGWQTPLISTNHSVTVMFNETGHYEWIARSPDVQHGDRWETHAAGEVSIVSNNTNELSLRERLQIAGAIIHNSDIPWNTIGKGSGKGISIAFTPAIFDMLSDAKKYYAARADQIIPFDVPIIIEDPYRNDK